MNKNKKIKKLSLYFEEFTLSAYSLSVKKQTFFAKRLSFLVKAGISILESLHLLSEQTKNKKEKELFKKLIDDVSNGQTLANSISNQKNSFGNFAVNIIRAGESSGTLTQNLNYLADELKKKELLRKKIMSALLYPIIISIATFGITGLLIIYIFPKILPIFASLKTSLPWTTRAVIAFSNLIKNQGLYILLGLILFVVVYSIFIKKNRRARLIHDRMILHIPIIGKIVRNYNLTNSFRTLGLLLKSGLSLTESLSITTETTENEQYKRKFSELGDHVVLGKGLSEKLHEDTFLFPEMSEHLITVGERTGNLSNTLLYLSEYYENEFEDQTKNLSSSIEPALMIIMGLLVGFVAISVITPIYAITTNLKR